MPDFCKAPWRSAPARERRAMMNAALMLSDRLKKLRSQISEARQAGDEAATSKLIDEHNKNLKKHNEIIEKNLCRLHFELVGGGCFSVTMPRDSYANYACNPLTLVLPSLEKNIARCAAEDPDAVEEADERKAFFKTLREMLAARGARPLAVTVSVDGGAAMPVDVEAPLEMSWGRWARPSKPSEVTIRFTPKALAEVLAAPRCLLVIADPGGCRLFPLDEPTLATPVLDLAWQVMGGAAVDDDDLRADALGALRRAVVPYVAVDDKADASKPGRERRADYLAKVHAGKPVNLKGLAPVRSEATIADVTDPFCDAPFAVLYVMGCGKPPECPRLTLSVRDTYGATSTTVVDSVVDSSGKWLPCDLEKLMEMAMTLATSATSAGVRGNVGDDVYRVLSKWLQNPTSVINISVNGAPPQLVLEAGAVIGDPRLARDGIATLDVDVLVPTLPAPGGRTPAQKLWLEPEVPCLLAACVAALEAGEPHPSTSWKKLRVLGEKLGVRSAKSEVHGLMLLIALGRFPRPSASDATSPFRRSVAVLADMNPEVLHNVSWGHRQFLDEHCRDLGARARKDALLMLVAKRLSRLTRGSGSGRADAVSDQVLSDGNRASGHPHAVTSSLVFAYWVAEGGAKGYGFRTAGVRYTYTSDLACEGSRCRFVGAVLRASLHEYGDYDAGGAERAKRSLTDLAVLWTAKFDPDARLCYEAAGAAGNALAAIIAARLGTESPASLKKLLKKYPLEAFAMKHLERLPTGLERLEAAVFRHDPDDEDDDAGAARSKPRGPRSAPTAATAAAVGDSFALENPGTSGALSKKKQAERERKAQNKEKEEKRKAKKKVADARRREVAEREATVREEAAREAAKREAAERAAHEATEAAKAEKTARAEAERKAAERKARKVTEAAEAEAAARVEAEHTAAERAARETLEAAEAAAREEAAARQATERDWSAAQAARRAAADREAEAASLALARQLEAEDRAAAPPAPPAAQAPPAWGAPPPPPISPVAPPPARALPVAPPDPLVLPGLPGPPAWDAAAAVADPLWSPAADDGAPPAWDGDDASARPRSDSDFVVPEGLVDVERRSNCSLDAIIAVLSQSPTFRRELGDGAEVAGRESAATPPPPPDPDLLNSLYKSKMCTFGESCPHLAKKACQYAHSAEELEYWRRARAAQHAPAARAPLRPSTGALRHLGAAFRASAGGADAEVDTAVDGLRTAMAVRAAEGGEGVRSELATGGAHLDVAEVLGELVAVLGTAKRCRAAAKALRTMGHIHQLACVKCKKRNEDFRDDVAFDELARSAPAAALVYAAQSDGCVADVFREAHAHAAKSCDACRAPGACEVDMVLEHAAKALVLSLAWYSTDQEGDDVAALLELVWRDTPLPAKRVFSSIGRVKFEVDLFAVVVFQDAH